MRQLILACLMIQTCLIYGLVNGDIGSVCDGPSDLSKLAGKSYLTNYIVDKGIIELRPVNASKLDECIRMCCDKINCNYAFYKNSLECFLVACQTDHACRPIANRGKKSDDPVDHLVRVRSVLESKRLIKTLVDKERKELSKIENTLVAAAAAAAAGASGRGAQTGHTATTNGDENPSCLPMVMLANNSPCPINERCVPRSRVLAAAAVEVLDADTSSSGYECVCPREQDMRRVEGVCREYLADADSCMLNLSDECDKSEHEECVVAPSAPATRAKHGTCQCLVGFRRDPDTYKCMRVDPSSLNRSIIKKKGLTSRSSRRRPSPPVSLEETDEADESPSRSEEHHEQPKEESPSLMHRLLADLGLIKQTESEPKSSHESNTNKIIDKLKKEDHVEQQQQQQATKVDETTAATSSTTTTTTTATTTTTTTTTMANVKMTTTTEPPNICTQQLCANAGEEMHVYYPSSMCVLNGGGTRFLARSAKDQIVRWMWVKSDTSPAFGQFVGTNESPTVIYEKMVEGVYTFILKVWTNTNEYSQSIVHVYVHSTLNTNRTTTTNTSASSGKFSFKQERELNENIIQIELDIEPNMFSESLKTKFLEKFQRMLEEHSRQFHGLIKPRVVLVNTRIAAPRGYSTRSSVVLELIVTDRVPAEAGSLEVELPPSALNGLVYDEHVDLVGQNRRIVDNSHLIRLMRRHQKVFHFSFDKIQSMWAYFGYLNSSSSSSSPQPQKSYSMLDSLDVKILTVSKLTCTSDFYAAASPHANSYNCSNHGKCDFNSHRCICDHFWMPNLYLRYFDYESDLTDGNNCEYNIPWVIIISLLVITLIVMTVNILFKYFFYYIFCCCLCNRNKPSAAVKNRLGRKFHGDTSYLDEDELNTSEQSSDRTSLIKSKARLLKKQLALGGRFAGKDGSGRHQYSLLRNEDNESGATWRGSRPGDQFGGDEDEDVIFDQSNENVKTRSSSSSVAKLKPKDDVVKKYSVI